MLEEHLILMFVIVAVLLFPGWGIGVGHALVNVHNEAIATGHGRLNEKTGNFEWIPLKAERK